MSTISYCFPPKMTPEQPNRSPLGMVALLGDKSNLGFSHERV